MRFLFVISLLSLVSCRVDDLKRHFLSAAKRDIIPSLVWASRQVDSLVPALINSQILDSKGSIQSCLIQFGIIVIKELEPGLEKCCIELFQKHPSETQFTQQEISDFFVELSHEWSMALKRSLEVWIHTELDSLLGIFSKKLSIFGIEILGKLGRALSTFRSSISRSAAPHQDLFVEIKLASKDVASASLFFLRGSGWMSTEFRKFENLTWDLDNYDFE